MVCLSNTARSENKVISNTLRNHKLQIKNIYSSIIIYFLFTIHITNNNPLFIIFNIYSFCKTVLYYIIINNINLQKFDYQILGKFYVTLIG